MYPTEKKLYAITQAFGANHKVNGKWRYDPYHHGTDLRTRSPIYSTGVGMPITAAQEGLVVRAYKSTTYGLCVQIEHLGKARGFYSLYAHLSGMDAKNGDTVSAGQTIGYSGNTGASVAPHLHFELRYGENLYTNTVDMFNPDNIKNFVKNVPRYLFSESIEQTWEDDAEEWGKESGVIIDWSRANEPMSQTRIAASLMKFEIYLKDKYKL